MHVLVVIDCKLINPFRMFTIASFHCHSSSFPCISHNLFLSSLLRYIIAIIDEHDRTLFWEMVDNEYLTKRKSHLNSTRLISNQYRQ